MKNHKTFILIAALLTVTAAAILAPPYITDFIRNQTRPDVTILPLNTFDETLRVVGDYDNDPYSFVKEDGSYAGHDVELAAELANRLGINLELELMSWSDALDAVAAGEADVLMGAELYHGDKPRAGMVMSVPIASDSFVVFTRSGVDDISMLYGSRIASIERGGAEFILDAYRLTQFCSYYKSHTDAFLSLSRGETDCVIARYSVGQLLCEKLGLNGVKATDVQIIDNNLCFGISEGNAELRERINDEIVSMISDGTTQELKEKWLGCYVRIQTLFDFCSNNLWIVVIYMAAVAVILIWYIAVVIKSSRRREKRLKKLAQTDPLTGLYNRASAEDMIKEALAESVPKHRHALLIIDIDNFKDVNDRFGHMQGDEVLRTLTANLRATFREDDIIGRLGGDEFFVFMKNINISTIVGDKSRQLRALFSKSCTKSELNYCITASIGAAIFPEHGRDFDTLYKCADAALYLTKANGKDSYTIFEL